VHAQEPGTAQHAGLVPGTSSVAHWALYDSTPLKYAIIKWTCRGERNWPSLPQQLRCTGRSGDDCRHDALGCCQRIARLTQPAASSTARCCLWLHRLKLCCLLPELPKGMRSIHAVCLPAFIPGGGSCSSSLYCAWIALCSTGREDICLLFDHM
jgi:hypothetical protein